MRRLSWEENTGYCPRFGLLRRTQNKSLPPLCHLFLFEDLSRRFQIVSLADLPLSCNCLRQNQCLQWVSPSRYELQESRLQTWNIVSCQTRAVCRNDMQTATRLLVLLLFLKSFFYFVYRSACSLKLIYTIPSYGMNMESDGALCRIALFSVSSFPTLILIVSPESVAFAKYSWYLILFTGKHLTYTMDMALPMVSRGSSVVLMPIPSNPFFIIFLAIS